MTQAEPASYPRFPLKLPAIILVVMLIAFAVLFTVQSRTLGAEAVEQIHFNHNKHVSAGVPCLFCHATALDGPIASIPSQQKCVGCHQNVQVTSVNGQAYVKILMDHWQKSQPLLWLRVTNEPDFVTFNHRPHIANAVNCETCHGNVGQMTVTEPAYLLNMGFCLNCHRQQAPEKQAKLTSCATCHH
jgi:hypothetical protein